MYQFPLSMLINKLISSLSFPLRDVLLFFILMAAAHVSLMCERVIWGILKIICHLTTGSKIVETYEASRYRKSSWEITTKIVV